MSSSITDPTNTKNGPSDVANTTSLTSKGKSKAKADDSMEADEEEDGDEEDEDEDEAGSDEEDEEEMEESLEEIDPSAILPTGRRTRGVKVDYTSKEALAKAGLQNQNNEEDDSDEDVEMKD